MAVTSGIKTVQATIKGQTYTPRQQESMKQQLLHPINHRIIIMQDIIIP